jgi:CBS domain-containing protein
MVATLGEIACKKTQVLWVDSETKVKDVAAFLKEHNILSAPVFDEKKNQFIGMIDTFEIMLFTVLGVFGDKVYQDDEFVSLDFPNKTVGEMVQKHPKLQRLVVMSVKDPLTKAMEILGKWEKRILVDTSKEANPPEYRLISQLDIVMYFHEHSEELKSCPIKMKDVAPILAAEPCGKYLVCINAKNKALDAFLKMTDERVNAVAVIDDNGRLVANLSSSELRGLDEETLKHLEEPVIQFLEKTSGHHSLHPITCKPSGFLHNMIPTIVHKRIHRVWVEEDEKPIGVATLTDIIKTLTNVVTSE